MIKSAKSSQEFWKAIATYRSTGEGSNPILEVEWRRFNDDIMPRRSDFQIQGQDARHPSMDLDFTTQEI